jgi:citrate lyase subunit beta/citryl-CoA lyase
MPVESDRREFTGDAGNRGPRVRSDCWIGFEPAASGALEIDLRSTVESSYGDSIRSLLRSGCEQLGVGHGRLRCEDGGALPYVLMARLEAALRAALPEQRPRWLPEQRPLPAASPRERRRRSRLYLPGSQPKLFVNAALYRPDAIILDLEDAVAPAAKDASRILVRNALRQVDFGPAERMVRINQGELGLRDLEEIAPERVELILIPKVESAADVARVDTRVRELTSATIWLMPIIESALGVLNAFEIARASERNVALTIGLEDYTADLGVARTTTGGESLWARSMLVNAARAAGLQAIDSVFSDVADEAGLRASILEAKALGFEGKGCIHPRQIPVVHDAFAPTAAEIDKACRIVRAFRDAERRGLGVVSLGSKMIDPPVVKRALTTVDAALAADLLVPEWLSEGENA